MTAAASNPFLGLIAPRERRLPVTGAVTRVVNGHVISARQQSKAPAIVDGDIDEARRLRRERELSYYRDYYRRHKDTPEYQAKVKAWRQQDKAAAKARWQAWADRNRQRIRTQQAEWRQELYHRDPEARELQKAAQRAYYARNREAILAKKRMKRQAAKAASTMDKAS